MVARQNNLVSGGHYSKRFILKMEGSKILVIGNGKLFTRDENNTYFSNGAVAMEGSKIIAVGNTAKIVVDDRPSFDVRADKI